MFQVFYELAQPSLTYCQFAPIVWRYPEHWKHTVQTSYHTSVCKLTFPNELIASKNLKWYVTVVTSMQAPEPLFSNYISNDIINAT